MLEVNCFLQCSFLKLTCRENIVLLSPQSLNEEEEKKLVNKTAQHCNEEEINDISGRRNLKPFLTLWSLEKKI